MYLSISRSPNSCSFYVVESYRNEQRKTKTRVVERLGTEDEIKRIHGVEDAENWCRAYVAKKNQEAQQIAAAKNRSISVELCENKPKAETSAPLNVGYLILQSLFYRFGLGNICDEIRAKHPHVRGFSLEKALQVMLFGRIITPSSKLMLSDKVQQSFLEQFQLEPQHLYRAMDLLQQHNTLIQDRLFHYTGLACGGRNVSRLYYDCTNFYTEKEQEDCDVKGKSEKWQQEHTLRKYGRSKENRPNPIVQMGLFMDGDGMPLGFCINPGNTNEQTTLQPLEEKLLRNFATADVVVCTDSDLAYLSNRKFNDHRAEDDPAVQFGLKGERRFICVQSIKELKHELKDWALDQSGWTYQYREHSKVITVRDFNLSSICEENYAELREVIFYKERTIAEQGVVQRLIISFSLRYQEYLRALRERKVKRAGKLIATGAHNREAQTSPKSLIITTHTTSSGETATRTSADINQQKVDEEARYDGFYGLATNLFKEECSTQQVVAINDRRWEIEECFRIMKTDLKSRPFYHNKDDLIVAHFQTCFIALLLIRGLERMIAQRHPVHEHYPNGKYTVTEILQALRELEVVSIGDGKAYMPTYNNSELITELLEIFDLQALGNQVVMKDTLKKILKKIKTSPEPYKDKQDI